MKNWLRHNIRMVVFGAGLLAAGVFLLGTTLKPFEARGQGGTTAFVGSEVFGIATGQTARFCVGTTSPRGPALDWTGRITDERGNLLFQMPAKNSPSGEWRCGDVPRSSIPVAGEVGTGRAQVAVRLEVKAPSGTKPSDFIGSFELVNPDGTSAGAVAAVIWAATHNNDLN